MSARSGRHEPAPVQEAIRGRRFVPEDLADKPDRLRVLVNAAPALGVSTGIGRYVRSLYGAMQALYPGSLDVSFFTGSGVLSELPPAAADRGAMLAARLLWKAPPFLSLAARQLQLFRREQLLRRLAPGFDLYHETAYFPPILGDTPVLFTVHDLSLLRHPGWHPEERVRFFQAFYRKRFPLAGQILTVSQHSLLELRTLMPWLAETPASVTPLGVDRQVFCPRPEQEIACVLAELRLPRRFVLSVCSGDPRKNLEDLVAVWNSRRRDLPLVLTGWRGWQSFPKGKDVMITGFVPDAQLACLYSAAELFIFPSLYEGFGLPVAEALACGCPVLSSNAGGLPETGNCWATYFDPQVQGDLQRKLEKLLADATWRRDMRQKLREAAPDKGWEAAAAKTLAAMHSLTSRPAGEAKL